MLCAKCAGENAADAHYCASCGAPLTPPGVAPAACQTSGFAIASLVLGIVALISGGLAAIPGIILGIVGVRQINRSGGRLAGRGLAVAGMWLSGVGVFLLLLGIIIVAVFVLPQVRTINDLVQRAAQKVRP